MKNKLLDYQYLLYLVVFFIGSYFLVVNNNAVELDYDELLKNANNILLQEPVGITYADDDFAAFVPRGYDIEEIDNGLYLDNGKMFITIYSGLGVSSSNEIINSLNPSFEKVAEVNPSVPNGGNYIGLWEYPIEGHDDYLQLVIVNEDSFIASVFEDNEASASVFESSYVFNSIK